MLEFLAIILALALGYAVSLHHKPKSREQLRRQYEAARNDRVASKQILKLYQRATTEQLTRELAGPGEAMRGAARPSRAMPCTAKQGE